MHHAWKTSPLYLKWIKPLRREIAGWAARAREERGARNVRVTRRKRLMSSGGVVAQRVWPG